MILRPMAGKCLVVAIYVRNPVGMRIGQRGTGFRGFESPLSARVRSESTRQKPSFPEVAASSKSGQSLPSSRMEATDTEPIRPPVTTQITTQVQPDDVVAIDPDLAEIVDALSKLPEANRQGIAAMVRAAVKRGVQKEIIVSGYYPEALYFSIRTLKLAD
jgi:hypothetical protein